MYIYKYMCVFFFCVFLSVQVLLFHTRKGQQQNDRESGPYIGRGRKKKTIKLPERQVWQQQTSTNKQTKKNLK